ncbi:hypothetical protein C7S17_0156 [Burkholderia thailandensis]|nr:hypothetical protein [Burkholderia thailandensis]
MAVEGGSAKHLTPRCSATFQPEMKRQDSGAGAPAGPRGCVADAGALPPARGAATDQ